MIRSDTKIQMIALFQSGKSLNEIAIICDCTAPAVRRILKEAGIYDGRLEQSKNGTRNGYKKKGISGITASMRKRDTIVSLYEQGKTVVEIMEATNLSRPTVIKVLKAETDYEPIMGRPKQAKQPEIEGIHKTDQ